MKKQEIKLNHKQSVWLDTHGGRDQFDVEVDENGMYVWMADGSNQVKVYLPVEK